MLTDAELTTIAESPYKGDFPLLAHNPTSPSSTAPPRRSAPPRCLTPRGASTRP